MKNLYVLIVISVFFFVSCDQHVVEDNTAHSDEYREVLSAAIAFSVRHDVMVSEMLRLEQQLLGDKLMKDLSEMSSLNIVLEVISGVIGIQPRVSSDPQRILATSFPPYSGADYFVVDLDQEELSLAPYASTDHAMLYFNALDDVSRDDQSELPERLRNIAGVQNEIMLDKRLGSPELLSLLTAVEVLKGSLMLWSQYLSESQSVASVDSPYKSSPQQWSFSKKLAFVAAADAIGGAIGYFTGGFVIVSGTPVFLPTGPMGMVGTAAGLSYLASKQVGWQ